MPRFLLLFSFIFFTFYLPAQRTVGLFQNDSLALNGYTLFMPNNSNTTYLIDNCGDLVNSWTSDFQHGSSAYLLEDGTLLRASRINSNFNSGGTGGRLERFDWEGNLIWSYNYSSDTFHQHHDIAYLPNGNILLIAWEARSIVEATASGRDPATIPNNGVWSEQIIELEPIGTDDANIVWEWHLWDHLIQDFDNTKDNYGIVADHPELVNVNFATGGGIGPGGGVDWIHFNAINYNPNLDQIVVSSRSFNEFWVIDHSTTSAEAAGHEGGNSGKGGDILYRWGNPQAYDRGNAADQTLYGQHDVQWIETGLPDEGKIMIFNNGQNRPGGNYSSIDVIQPPVDNQGNYTISSDQAFGPADLFWTYEDPANFYSENISGAHRLANGNTIICQGRFGHLFEITYDGQIVWDYINPVKNTGPVSQGTIITGNNVFRAYRYTPDYPGFTGKDLTPGDPIELNPLPSDCQIWGETVAVHQVNTLENVKILANPFSEQLKIENSQGKLLTIRIVDGLGRIFSTKLSNQHFIQLDTGHFHSGFYLAYISDTDSKKINVYKLLKYD